MMNQPLGPAPVTPAAGGVAVCQDCAAPISGNYCSNCGQETLIETPTVRQFVHELMDQYVAVEGKLGRTLRVLITQPGQLTLDYVQGRRQRYVRPLKLYVSVSVVFFGLRGILPDSIGNPFMKVDPSATQQAPAARCQPMPATVRPRSIRPPPQQRRAIRDQRRRRCAGAAGSTRRASSAGRPCGGREP